MADYQVDWSKNKLKIAIAISTFNNLRFVLLASTAAQIITVFGYEAIIFDSQNNPSTESDNFENLISAGFTAIIFNSSEAGPSEH